MNSNAGMTYFISCSIAFLQKSVPFCSSILRPSATVFGSSIPNLFVLAQYLALTFLMTRSRLRKALRTNQANAGSSVILWASLATQGISSHFNKDNNNNATEEARIDSQVTEAINENQTRIATAMDQYSAVDQLPVLPLAETQLHAPMTPAVQPPLLPSTPLITPRPPTPTMSLPRGSCLLILDLSSLLQRQTSEIHLCNAVHPSACKLKNECHAKSQLPRSTLSISQSSCQLASNSQWLK